MVKNSLSISCVDFIATKRFSGFSSAFHHRAQAHNVQPIFPPAILVGGAVTVFSLLLIPIAQPIKMSCAWAFLQLCSLSTETRSEIFKILHFSPAQPRGRRGVRAERFAPGASHRRRGQHAFFASA